MLIEQLDLPLGQKYWGFIILANQSTHKDGTI